ncbi:MAG: R.Pab1 family restriction endonuclease [Verrucomicrobia bacterium]|nr:R.Pab1 family restriction endonuclease [Verrucomicrobiota bacterium]
MNSINGIERVALRLVVALALTFTWLGRAFAADTEYKLVRIDLADQSVRVRLPLTDVSGKVRPKERTPDGYGEPLAPTKTALGANHYLEWQIGYDTREAGAPNVVKEIQFVRRGETKFGAELSKILVDALRLGVISTNDLLRERDRLAKLAEATLEEREGITTEKTPLESKAGTLPDGFTRWTQKVPQFQRETVHGWIQIQLKPRQRAVGNQAMVYVCLPMNRVLTADGKPRAPGPAKTKETVFYDFNRANAGFLLDIVRAFAIASKQHNEDMGQILGRLLEPVGKPSKE